MVNPYRGVHVVNTYKIGVQGLSLWCLTPLSKNISTITLSHNVVSITPCHEQDSNSQL